MFCCEQLAGWIKTPPKINFVWASLGNLLAESLRVCGHDQHDPTYKRAHMTCSNIQLIFNLNKFNLLIEKKKKKEQF